MLFCLSECTAQQTVTKIHRIRLIPASVARRVLGRPEIHVPVAQLVAHLAQHLKQRLWRHRIGHLRSITLVHLVPVQTVFFFLIVKETIVAVEDAPQCLKVISRSG